MHSYISYEHVIHKMTHTHTHTHIYKMKVVNTRTSHIYHTNTRIHAQTSYTMHTQVYKYLITSAEIKTSLVRGMHKQLIYKHKLYQVCTQTCDAYIQTRRWSTYIHVGTFSYVQPSVAHKCMHVCTYWNLHTHVCTHTWQHTVLIDLSYMHVYVSYRARDTYEIYINIHTNPPRRADYF
jgi:hypothetical protein